MWIAAHTVIIIALAGWILVPNTKDPDTVQAAPPAVAAENKRQAERQPPTKDQVMQIPGVRFGISTPQAPWSSAELNTAASAVGTHPTVVEYFVKWTQDFRADSVPQTYRQGAVPVISWEPWAGLSSGVSQPPFALSRITKGQYDAYITKF